VGIADDRGPLQLNNATIALYDKQGATPTDIDRINQTNGFCAVLELHGVKVLRPENVKGVLQIFVRDLGFVIDDTFVWCNPKKEKRRLEQDGLRNIIEQERLRTVTPPSDIRIEGGDVVLLQGRVLVGVGSDPARARTGAEAVEFLKNFLPEREIIPVAIHASDDSQDDPKQHVLHLDCAFQPIGADSAILFDEGFVGSAGPILDLIADDHLLHVSGEEMFHLWPNLFSVSSTTVVSGPSFARLNAEIRALGLNVVEVPYEEVAKLGGLFRCSTLPLRRSSSEEEEESIADSLFRGAILQPGNGNPMSTYITHIFDSLPRRRADQLSL
jgi:N-dimethylarginine dimethylaminohydrolase